VTESRRLAVLAALARLKERPLEPSARMGYSAIARELGLTRQRVQQIATGYVSPPKKKKPTAP
jgi:hypothetical protein